MPSIVNPFDAYALEAAARIKDGQGGRITVMTMGPPQAVTALRECLEKGADKAYLVSDRVFGGSDTLATSYILSGAIGAVEAREGPFNVIFCGKQAIDGDTAQVGPEIAEHLDLPQVTYGVEVTAGEGSVVVKRESDGGYQLIEMKTPCLVTVTKPAFEPQMPTTRPAFGGNLMATILCPDHRPQIGTVRPGVFKLKAKPDPIRQAQIVREDIAASFQTRPG